MSVLLNFMAALRGLFWPTTPNKTKKEQLVLNPVVREQSTDAHRLSNLLQKQGVEVSITPPIMERLPWFLDMQYGPFQITFEWSERHGFWYTQSKSIYGGPPGKVYSTFDDALADALDLLGVLSHDDF